mmetsp:Transcript_694/g.836  ORF Transcript_694/g.836 Transcript_694/m.836 type:complete len:419 (-) Transcript_694:298-1554(-)
MAPVNGLQSLFLQPERRPLLRHQPGNAIEDPAKMFNARGIAHVTDFEFVSVVFAPEQGLLILVLPHQLETVIFGARDHVHVRVVQNAGSKRGSPGTVELWIPLWNPNIGWRDALGVVRDDFGKRLSQVLLHQCVMFARASTARIYLGQAVHTTIVHFQVLASTQEVLEPGHEIRELADDVGDEEVELLASDDLGGVKGEALEEVSVSFFVAQTLFRALKKGKLLLQTHSTTRHFIFLFQHQGAAHVATTQWRHTRHATNRYGTPLVATHRIGVRRVCLREKVNELMKKIGIILKENFNVAVNFFNGLSLLTVQVKNCQKRLVYALVTNEAGLNLVHVINGFGEFDSLAFQRFRLRLNFVILGEKIVKTSDKIILTFEQYFNFLNYACRSNLFTLEILHDVKKLVVNIFVVHVDAFHFF